VKKFVQRFNCWSNFYIRNRDSAVSIATGYGLDDRGFGVRVPVGSRIFLCSPDRLWGPLSLLSNGYWGYSGRGVKLTTHLQLVPRSIGSIHPLPFGEHLINESVSVTPSNVIEASIVLFMTCVSRCPISLLAEHPIYLHVTLRFAFISAICNLSRRFLYIDTTCFGLIDNLEVYSLLWLINMLLTVITTDCAPEGGRISRNIYCQWRENGGE
jgi:hypothetical protein